MIDRLFSPAFGNRPQIFVGRRDTINDVMSGLKEMPGSKERAVLLLGQRGYGKTVLLLAFVFDHYIEPGIFGNGTFTHIANLAVVLMVLPATIVV